MSLAKFGPPVYKVYEPGYHPHRTIILDEQIESPETLTIHLAEEAARGGGDLSGDSPTGLLPMSAFKPQLPQLHGYADPQYSQQQQSFSTQQSGTTASQINQLAFAANNAATGQYLSAQVPSNICVHACHPKTGSFGTKVLLKVESEYDLTGTSSSPAPFVSVLFGSQRCTAEVSKDCGICAYDVTAEAPQFLSTTCPSLSNVPLTLVVENANGAEIARVNNAGTFSYHDAQGKSTGGSVGVGGPGDTSPSDLGSPKPRSPVHRHSPPHQSLPVSANTTSPPTNHGIASVPTTNTYGFPPSVSAAAAAAQAQVQAQSDYVANTAGAYTQGTGSMLGAYRGASFADHYPRVPPILRSPHGATWTPFGSHIDSIRSPTTAVPHGAHTSLVRPGFTTLQHSGAPTPPLIRTSTLTQQAGTAPSTSAGYNPYGLYQTKATLEIHGDLQAMAENWTHEEWENKRRLVMFKKKQIGSVLTITFKPVSISERPPNSICISCIWWQEKEECFVTSVDTIHLLEQLLAAPSRFSVEEKNRIRRNLEGFHPLTVSKAKAESEEFFKVIMSFGNPKPRNIEKDVKVFTWKTLGQSLSKIISKYSASTATLATPSNSSHLLTPASLSGSYSTLPPASGPASSTTTAGDAGASAAYMGAVHHHPDSVASPGGRRLSSSTSWSPYGGAVARTMSPAMKTSSPIPTSSLRISTIPAVYDSRGSVHGLTSPYSVASASHHSSHHGQGNYSQSSASTTQSHTRNWEAYSVPESYPSHTSHSHYGGTTYGEGTQRA